MFVPGAADLRDDPPNEKVKDIGVAPPTAPAAHRTSTLYTSLTTALDHAQSRRYGVDHATSLTNYLRHDIEGEFDRAIAGAFHARTHGPHDPLPTIAIEEVRNLSSDDDTGPFPLFRRDKDGGWTMVVQNARVTYKQPTVPDRNVVVDFMRLDLRPEEPPQ